MSSFWENLWQAINGILSKFVKCRTTLSFLMFKPYGQRKNILGNILVMTSKHLNVNISMCKLKTRPDSGFYSEQFMCSSRSKSKSSRFSTSRAFRRMHLDNCWRRVGKIIGAEMTICIRTRNIWGFFLEKISNMYEGLKNHIYPNYKHAQSTWVGALERYTIGTIPSCYGGDVPGSRRHLY